MLHRKANDTIEDKKITNIKKQVKRNIDLKIHYQNNKINECFRKLKTSTLKVQVFSNNKRSLLQIIPEGKKL